ncbi:MAG: carbohydrate kinase family protein [Synergistaceae bacterium]|nr:carbohydrate kinase family protein [Synergistaceae bacterium]
MENKKYVVAIGSSSLDTYYESLSWPALGDKVMVKKIGTKVGGLISNAACVMASCGIPTYLIDTVKPGLREQIVQELDRYGVCTDYVTPGDESIESETTIILVGGERTIFVSKNKPPIDLSPAQVRLFEEAAVVYSILPEIRKIRECETLLKSLKSKGVQLVWDMEPAAFNGGIEDQYLIKMADLLFFNEWGIEKYASDLSLPVNQAIAGLLDAGVRIVVLTLAKKGCRVFTKDREINVDGHRVSVVDVTGAGDSFNSVFIYGCLNGWALERTAKMANAAGARAVTLMGPKSGAATIEEISGFLDQHEIKSAVV